MERWPYIVYGFEAVFVMYCILHSHGPQHVGISLSPLYPLIAPTVVVFMR